MKAHFHVSLLKAMAILLPVWLGIVILGAVVEVALNQVAIQYGWRQFNFDPNFMLIVFVFGYCLWKLENRRVVAK